MPELQGPQHLAQLLPCVTMAITVLQETRNCSDFFLIFFFFYLKEIAWDILEIYNLS